jgi:short-subunit dehydrogenase
MKVPDSKFVVIGASGDMGSETCRQLRACGSEVLLAGRNRERLSTLATELNAPFHVVDATYVG